MKISFFTYDWKYESALENVSKKKIISTWKTKYVMQMFVCADIPLKMSKKYI